MNNHCEKYTKYYKLYVKSLPHHKSFIDNPSRVKFGKLCGILVNFLLIINRMPDDYEDDNDELISDKFIDYLVNLQDWQHAKLNGRINYYDNMSKYARSAINYNNKLLDDVQDVSLPDTLLFFEDMTHDTILTIMSKLSDDNAAAMREELRTLAPYE